MQQTNIELLEKILDDSGIIFLSDCEELFSSPDNVEDIMKYVSSTKEEWESKKYANKAYLEYFTHKLYVLGFQILFLKAVIKYINDRLSNEPFFSDYEHAIRYSCIAAAGLKDLNELNVTEREVFFENLLTGIRFAGERGQKGYSYEGKEEIRRYAFLLTEGLVKEIAERNFLLNADSIIKKTTDDNMAYFVSFTCLTEKEKEKYRKIDNLLVQKCYASLALLADSLEQVFEEHMLSGFTKKETEEWQHVIELQGIDNEERVSIWANLAVWECSIKYRIFNRQYEDSNYKRESLYLEYKIDLENDKELWLDNKALLKCVYSGELSLDGDVNKEMKEMISHYLANWAHRSFSDNITQKELEVQCFWHDMIKERDVAENIIRVKGGPYVTHEKVDNKHIFTIDLPEKKTVLNQYRIKEAAYGAIKSINILLGRNGSGKTSTMMMLRYDGLEANKKKALTKFFIVYKRGEDYFYSTNLREEEYNLKGNVLKKGKQNISEYRGQKNKVIYYSNILQPYEERTELMASNIVDLSSQYIRDMEVVGLPRYEMIHIDEIHGKDREISLKHKRNHNQDVLRQLYFLCDTFDREESWMPKYVKRFVLMRCGLEALSKSHKINKYLTRNKFGNGFTVFQEHCEWKVFYHNKNELKKIIDICEKIIKDKEILYFEVRLPQMSSGEKARLTLFSRLHAWVRKMTFSDFRQNNVLLLDELEAYMHPEWQRCLIFDLISFLEWEHSIGHPVKVQLFISSNSPFLISDVDMDEITVMSKDIEVEEKTFAQNIHIILKDSFFNNSGAMGEYAKRKVDHVYKILTDCLDNENESTVKSNMQLAEECNNIIEKIGEPLIYKDLREMYEEIWGKEEKNTGFGKRFSEMSNEELEYQMEAAREELKRRGK